MTIELSSHWRGCPSHGRGARAAATQVLAGRDDAEVVDREVHDRRRRRRRSRFPGSPTIRIDGARRRPGGRGRAARADVPDLPRGRPRLARAVPRAARGGALDEPRRPGSRVRPARRRRRRPLARPLRRRGAARPRPVVQPLPVRPGVGGPDDRDRATTSPAAACGSSRSARTTRAATPRTRSREMKARAAREGLHVRLPLRRDPGARPRARRGADARGVRLRPRPQAALPRRDRRQPRRPPRSGSTTCATRWRRCSRAASPPVAETPAVGCSVKYRGA